MATSWAGDPQNQAVQSLYSCLRDSGLKTDHGLEVISARRGAKAGLYVLDGQSASFFELSKSPATDGSVHEDLKLKLPSQKTVFLNFDRSKGGDETISVHDYPSYKGSAAEAIGGRSGTVGPIGDTLARLSYHEAEGGSVPDERTLRTLGAIAYRQLHGMLGDSGNEEIREWSSSGSNEVVSGFTKRVSSIHALEARLKSTLSSLVSLEKRLKKTSRDLFHDRIQRDLALASVNAGTADSETRAQLHTLQSRVRSAKLSVASLKQERARLESESEALSQRIASQTETLDRRRNEVAGALESVKSRHLEILATCSKIPDMALHAKIVKWQDEVHERRTAPLDVDGYLRNFASSSAN
ncbi:MAG: hypothetical protein ACXWPM_10710 [Bdellovibrionota bacterium]